LQRPDVDGVLDGDSDVLMQLSPDLGCPIAWYKTTISCFRTSELIDHYAAQGWDVTPMLVARDVRAVWSSIAKKHYVRNGITAEDPPWRLRVRRFKEDFELFAACNWPILRYESLVSAPEETLRAACRDLKLNWHEHMLTWPKPAEAIANKRHGNGSFRSSRQGGLQATLDSYRERKGKVTIPADDLAWLETEFRDFNAQLDYPDSLAEVATLSVVGSSAAPSFEATRRLKWELRRKPLRWLATYFGAKIPSRWDVQPKSNTATDTDEQQHRRAA
jgi:hypothetical protein